MKKNGIINPQLIKELTGLGHFDSFVICDMGFPIPKDAVGIDLTIIPGYPRILPVLISCLSEVVVQKIILVEGIKTANQELHGEILGLLHNQEVSYCDFVTFREKARDAKFYIRTAETMPCSNIILESASGVKERVDRYNIEVDVDAMMKNGKKYV